MKKQRTALQTALDTNRMVRIHTVTASDNEYFDGFVVGLGEAFALIHILNSDLMVLNGYTVLPLRQVRNVRSLEKFNDFEERVLALKNIAPEPQPDVLLKDFPGLLSSVNSHFPLVAIHTEHLYPDECYIGRVAEMKTRSVLLREIDPNAKWRQQARKYRFKNITRVDFGGGYEAALWAVAEANRQTSS